MEKFIIKNDHAFTHSFDHDADIKYDLISTVLEKRLVEFIGSTLSYNQPSKFIHISKYRIEMILKEYLSFPFFVNSMHIDDKFFVEVVYLSGDEEFKITIQFN